MYQCFVHKFQTNIFFYKTIWSPTFFEMSVNLAKKWAKLIHVRELKLEGKYEPNKYEPRSWANKVFTLMFIHLCRWYILPLIIFRGSLCFFLLLNQYFLKIILYNYFLFGREVILLHTESRVTSVSESRETRCAKVLLLNQKESKCIAFF